MVSRFLINIKSKEFFDIKKRLLLAVSGGIDSMVLLHLMQQTDYQISVAHINHNTRNGESFKDQKFVENYCKNQGIKCYTTNFEHQPDIGNFHDLARQFRYEWMKSLGYDYILTAHHYDDNLETIFLNFINGRSLMGIPQQNGSIIRPMLEFKKDEIKDYAQVQNLEYVDDSSNAQTSYDRNYIRHNLLPQLRKRWPELDNKILSLSNRKKNQHILLQDLLHESDYLKLKGEQYFIAKDKLGKKIYLLAELIKPFGFNTTHAENLIASWDSIGAQFHSDSFTMLNDRKDIIISPLYKQINPIEIDLNQLPQTVSFGPAQLQLKLTHAFVKNTKPSIAYFPINKLQKELTVRTWKEGDHFQPFGMNGKSQSLKKFFTNNKINRLDKISTPIICSGEDIIWIAGMRTDDRYRCSDEQSFLRIAIEKIKSATFS